jgi:O-antigen ligase
MLVCSIAMGGAHDILQSILTVRLFLFAAALDTWVLQYEASRRRLQWIVFTVALWVAAQCWQQYVTGTNFLGYPRWDDGALTGPFFRPRAGGTYLMLFFPAFLPGLMRILTAPALGRRLLGRLLFVIATTTMVMIGQRMPALLLLLGLLLTALLIRQFRLPIVIVMVAGALAIALTPILSPPTYAKLAIKFTEQMAHFWQSPYGLLFTRAAVMVGKNPWLGLGFDGFRNHCNDPIYAQGLPWAHIPASDPTNPDSCSIHPHNYYLLIATNAGLPGLGLFIALAICWLRRIFHGMRVTTEPRRTALFVIVFLSLWPLASTTTMFTFPNAGWMFLMIGWGLAEARPTGPASARGLTEVKYWTNPEPQAAREAGHAG